MSISFDVNNTAGRQNLLKVDLFRSLDQLNSDRQALWGKMTPQHMVEHLIWAFELSTGNLKVNCKENRDKLKKIGGFIYNNHPIPRNFNNPELPLDLVKLQLGSLVLAKARLKKLVNLFFEHRKESPQTSHVHPVFGNLNLVEWERIHYKHCIHHLLQFDLIEVEYL